MSILNDREIIELNIPATPEVFKRGLYSAMTFGGTGAVTNGSSRGILGDSILPIFRPTQFDNVIGWPIVAGCRTNHFSHEDLQGTSRTDADAIFNVIYPLYLERFQPMLTPFSSTLIREVDTLTLSATVNRNGALVDSSAVKGTRKIISKGLTSFGYDVSLDRNFKLFTNINSAIIDPKRLDEKCLVDAVVWDDPDGAEYVILPPNSYILGNTNEYFNMPRDIVAVCLGKSTYARAGAIVNVTPIEPEFKGTVVIEISNATTLPMKIYLNEGISQFLFFRGSGPCETSYADRDGKYQGQTGVTLPTV